MSTLKNIMILMGLWLWKQQNCSVIIFAGIGIIVIFSGIHFLAGYEADLYYQVSWKTLFLISLVALAIDIWALNYTTPKTNFRVAVAIGRRMLIKDDLSCWGVETIKRMVLEAEGMHQSERLGALIVDSRRLEQIRKEISRIEKKMEDLHGKVHSLRVEDNRLRKKLIV
ncbi:MAG: hypothetical protein V1845_02550 [bacterium]